MQRAKRIVKADSCYTKGITGRGIGVGVLDCGVIPHVDFAHRLIKYNDFLEGSHPKDMMGHGTHICGIIGGDGLGSSGLYSGMAPGVTLYVGRILDHRGSGSLLSLINGMEWLISISQEYNIKVINISISSLYFAKMEEEVYVFSLFQKAYENGISIVTSAGNTGPKTATVSKLGDSQYVICVGCHEGKEKNLFKNPCQQFSGRGPGERVYRKPDIVAPGTEIISCSGYKQYCKKTGTSMATGIVSGAIALAYEKYPGILARDMKEKVLKSTEDMGDGFWIQGYGMLNVSKLLCLE